MRFAEDELGVPFVIYYCHNFINSTLRGGLAPVVPTIKLIVDYCWIDTRVVLTWHGVGSEIRTIIFLLM